MKIIGLNEDDVDVYRSIRLRALRDDPDAFGSNFTREADFDEAIWRARLTSFAGRPGRIFVAQEDSESLGMVGVGLTDGEADAQVWGMWVSSAARGRGVGKQLLEAATRWAWELRAHTVTLWVRRDNAAAIALYQRDGFEQVDGATETAPDGCSTELCMRLRLDEPGAPDRIILSP